MCSYDRAGLGWSDPSPRPRTAEVMADELHALLHAAEIEGPYVLVGQSLGGVIARQFALAHPDDVAGMVLVDSATEGQNDRLPSAIMAGQASLKPMLRALSLAADAGLLALFPGVVPPLKQLPPDDAAAVHALFIVSGKTFRTGLAEIEDAELGGGLSPAPLGDIPLVVLRHSRTLNPVQGQVTEAIAQQYEQIWAQMQEDLAALSPRGRVTVAENSGHNIELDRPDLVIAAIQDVLAATR